MSQSPFAKYQAEAWPYWYEGSMLANRICGGVPSNEKTAEAWIRTKLKDTRSESEIQATVAKTVEEIRETHRQARRVSLAEGGTEVELANTASLTEEMTHEELVNQAVTKVATDMAGFNMFKRTPHESRTAGGLVVPAGTLYIEGRQLKAAMKEAVSVAANAGKLATKGWGNPDNAAYKKQLKGWFPEHVFVPDWVLPLFHEDGRTPVTEPDGVLQKFVHTHRGDAIGYEEYLEKCMIRFVVKSDVELSEKDWAMIWLTGQDQGVGASRSQGFGVYQVTEWAAIPPMQDYGYNPEPVAAE